MVSNLELTNDLRVVLVQDPKASEVQVTMRYQVGAVDDPGEQSGVAHLVEHLMFQHVLDGRSLFARLEDVSSAFAATTTFDATTYFIRADPSHLEELLAIEAARMQLPCSSVPDTTFVREREVLVNELRQRGYATEVVEKLHGTLYPIGHPYRRSVGGSEASVAKITKAQACAFADAHYAPGNAVLVVSGNVTLERLEGALAGVARVVKRAVTKPVPVAAVTAKGERLETSAPIDDELVRVAWPLPADLRERAKVRAVIPIIASMIDARIQGRVMPLELGDQRVPMQVLFVFPRSESMPTTLREAEAAIAEVPARFLELRTTRPLDRIVFSSMQQSAIYQEYAKLQDGTGRDAQLAGYVLAGKQPNAGLGSEFQGLKELNQAEASRVAGVYLRFDQAKVVLLHPSEREKRGQGVELTAPIHDLGQLRVPPDPIEATRPLSADPGSRPWGLRLGRRRARRLSGERRSFRRRRGVRGQARGHVRYQVPSERGQSGQRRPRGHHGDRPARWVSPALGRCHGGIDPRHRQRLHGSLRLVPEHWGRHRGRRGPLEARRRSPVRKFRPRRDRIRVRYAVQRDHVRPRVPTLNR